MMRLQFAFGSDVLTLPASILSELKSATLTELRALLVLAYLIMRNFYKRFVTVHLHPQRMTQ